MDKNGLKMYHFIIISFIIIIAFFVIYTMNQNLKIKELENTISSQTPANTLIEETEEYEKIGDVEAESEATIKDKSSEEKLEELNAYNKEIDDKYGEGISRLYSIVSEAYSMKENYTNNDVKVSFHMDNKIEYKDLSNTRKILSIINCSNKKNLDRTEDDYLVKKIAESNEDIKNALENNDTYSIEECFGDAKIYYNIKETANNIFKSPNDIVYENINNGYGHKLSYFDDLYCYHGYLGGGLGVVDYGWSEIQKVEKNDNQIIIYDKCIYIDYAPYWEVSDGTNDGLIHFYSSSNYKKELGAEKNIDGLKEDIEAFKYFFKKYENKLTTYKHIFEKSESGNNYYWVSSEPVI